MDFEKLKEKAEKSKAANKAFFKRLKKSDLNKLDDEIHRLHKEVFEEINCFDCGNCCSSLGPRVLERDIEKISSAIKKKPHEVVKNYLRVDEDGDFVFKEMPCPFLLEGNYCSIYADRPKACREYPHTDRKKFFQISELSIKNTETCPAVYEIFERLREKM